MCNNSSVFFLSLYFNTLLHAYSLFFIYRDDVYIGILLFFRNEFLFDLTFVKIMVCRKQKPLPPTLLPFFLSNEKRRKCFGRTNDRGFKEASNYYCIRLFTDGEKIRVEYHGQFSCCCCCWCPCFLTEFVGHMFWKDKIK